MFTHAILLIVLSVFVGVLLYCNYSQWSGRFNRFLVVSQSGLHSDLLVGVQFGIALPTAKNL